MIDIETLAGPAFLIAVSAGGVPAAPRLNAAGRSRPALARGLADWISAWDAGSMSALRGGALRGGPDGTVGEVVLAAPYRGDGLWRASMIPVTGSDGGVAALLGLCREVKAAARPSPQGSPQGTGRLSLALQAIHGAEWRYDAAAGVYEGSDEIATLMGEAEPRPVTWAEWLEHVHPQDLAPFLAAPEPEGAAEFRFHAADGALRWARCSRIAVVDAAGAVEAVLGIMVDITREHVRETAWAELATHDPLTGLLNRRGLREALDRLQGDPDPAPCLALFAVDLDHFKGTNDRHGHAAGDAVLVEASRRLAAAAAEAVATVATADAACARLGGDEFVALLPVSSEAEVQRIHGRLQRAFQRPLAFRGRWLPVSASVGVASGSGAIDIAELIDRADADLYARKRTRLRARVAA